MWWETAIFYEIYIRSFFDSNGDGIGDLNGIKEKLPYLSELGIDAIWITPFFPSPQVDFGYDISDFRAVDPIFGTIEDFKDLISSAKELDIKVIIDFVLAHTSNQHPFFLESKISKNSSKRDWYIWKDPKENGLPPTNWQGFEESTWCFDEKTDQFYYHFHYKEQPNLNWNNEDVYQEMLDSLKFWVDLGVSGVRLDAICTLVPDEKFRDNPLIDEVPEHLKLVYQYKQRQTYTLNQSKNYEVLKKFCTELKSYAGEDFLVIGESWTSTFEELKEYGGDKDHIVDLLFNFFLSSVPYLDTIQFREVIRAANEVFNSSNLTNVLSNHDFTRATSRYSQTQDSDKIAKLLLTLLLTLKEPPFLYYGEEIGLRNSDPESKSEVKDPRGKQLWPQYKGRDGARTPMQWDDKKYSGFSPNKPWLKIANDFKNRNTETQKKCPNSIYNSLKRLIKLRKRIAELNSGSIKVIGRSSAVLSYYRNSKEKKFLIALNLTNEESYFYFSRSRHKQNKKLIFSTDFARKNLVVEDYSFTLQAFEGVIIEIGST